MSAEKQFEKTFSRRRNKATHPSTTTKNVNNLHKTVDTTDKEERQVVVVVVQEEEEGPFQQAPANAHESPLLPSSTADTNNGSGNVERNQKRKNEEKESHHGKSKPFKAKPKRKQEAKKNNGEERKYENENEEEEGRAGCRFPVSRVDRIIRTQSSVYRLTHEAVFLINKATEKFLEIFSEDSYECATQDCKNYVSYNHLSTVVSKEDRFDFLSDYVPEKVKAEKALAERKALEK